MNSLPYDALIVHGNSLSKSGRLGNTAIQRLDIAIEGYKNNLSDTIVCTGGRSFLQRNSSPSESAAMEDYILHAGLSDVNVLTEPHSLETIGNVLFTKRKIVVPNNWKRLVVVTSDSHMERTLKIYHHIYDDTFDIQSISAPDMPHTMTKVKEFIGDLVVSAVFDNIKDTNDIAIQDKLFGIVPGYVSKTNSLDLLRAISATLFKRIK